MTMLGKRLLLPLLLVVALVAAGCGDDEDDGDTTTQTTEEPSDTTAGDDGEKGSITVGSADFAESSIVASMYAQVLAEAGYDVDEELNIGAREVYFPALEDGEVDLIPEFVGSLIAHLDGEEATSSDTEEAVTTLEGLLPDGVTLLEPAEAESKNVFVVTQETADEHGLETVSDLADVAGELTLGGPPECPERPFCILGLEDTYGVEFGTFKPLDVGGPITKEALTQGEIDVALLFTTDPGIEVNGWVMLEDDEELQPAENVVPVIREDVVDDEVTELLDAISEKLTQDEYNELIKRVYVDEEDPEAVAEDWLREMELLGG